MIRDALRSHIAWRAGSVVLGLSVLWIGTHLDRARSRAPAARSAGADARTKNPSAARALPSEGVRAWIDLLDDPRTGIDERADAARRAAEGWMAAENFEAAREVLLVGLALEPSDFVAQRLALTLGHCERRSDSREQALRSYETVASAVNAPWSLRREAEWWIARIEEDEGALHAAVRRYARLAEVGLEPSRRLRAYDRLARTYVRLGDLEAAAGVLHRCGIELWEDMHANNEEARRLLARFQSLHARERLVEAIEERRREAKTRR